MIRTLNCREQESHSLITEALPIGFQLLELPYKQAKEELAMTIQDNINMINLLNVKVNVDR